MEEDFMVLITVLELLKIQKPIVFENGGFVGNLGLVKNYGKIY